MGWLDLCKIDFGVSLSIELTKERDNREAKVASLCTLEQGKCSNKWLRGNVTRLCLHRPVIKMIRHILWCRRYFIVTCSLLLIFSLALFQAGDSHKQLRVYEAVERSVRPILDPPSDGAYNLSNIRAVLQSGALSWNFINEQLRTFFSDERPGFFVEAGALDGEFLSNSLWLEKERGWSGLLIEPHPHNYKHLRKKRRKAWSSNTCLSDTPHNKNITMTSFEARESMPSMRMMERGRTLRADHASQMTRSAADTNFTSSCFPLQAYLEHLGVSVLDFLSLDIQGSEKEVFDTIPLERITVRSVVMESETRQMDIQLVKHMNSKGYVFIAVGGSPDYFFIRRGDALLHKAKTKPMQHLIDAGVDIKFVIESTY